MAREGQTVEPIDIRTVANLEGGTIDVLSSGTVNQVGNIQHGTLELVQTVTSLQHGTIDQIPEVQIGTVNVVQSGTLNQVQNLQHGTIEQAGIFGVDGGGNIQQVRTNPGGTIITDIVANEIIATVGTVSQVENIQHGTLELVRQVTDVVNLQHGTIDQQKGGTINVVDQVTDLVNLQHGTIDQQKGGTINVVDQVTDVVNLQHGTIDQQKGGTINVVQDPRTDTNATIANNFTVDGTDQPAGTFNTDRFDSFTAFFQTQGAHGGTFTVEHQLRPNDAGSWYTDGQDGTITTDLVATINHKAQQYRPSLTNVSSGPSATVTVEGYGN